MTPLETLRAIRYVGVVAVAVVGLMETPASAAIQTGNTLLEACETTPMAHPKKMFCLGYVTAILDVYENSICDAASGAQVGQFVDIIVKHLREKPEIRHQPADTLSIGTIQSAFECD